MATLSAKTDGKLSFAKVAASGGKENVALASNKAASTPAVRMPPRPQSISTHMANIDIFKQVSASIPDANTMVPKHGTVGIRPVESIHTAQDAIEQATNGRSRLDARLIDAVSTISIGSMPSLVVNGSSALATSRMFSAGSSSDECRRTDSGSDIGTKPPSLDGKSITSGTTFALDEKESLRPDDSASVKAAEDDDTFSARGSIVAGSRIGSEAAAKAYRAQGHEITDRRTAAQKVMEHIPGIVTPQSEASGLQVVEESVADPLVGTTGSSEAFNAFYKQTPDEKLLEALDSPKDRLYLLRLEQDVIEFVKNSTDPFVDLPPCNSFCRMLTHKLADYYHMTHQVDATAGSVRIFRTPFCRLPVSLTSISTSSMSGEIPPLVSVPTMKIMRRGGENNGSPSKGTSDTGSDGKDKSMSAKEKLSREEREAAYIKARERIFGPEKSGQATPETEDGNDISRSSSISVKERQGQGKRGRPGKQRRDDSESFDVRSQYTPYFPQQPQPTWASTPQYSPMSMPPFVGHAPADYSAAPTNTYTQHPQQYGTAAIPTLQSYQQMPNHYARPSPPHTNPHSTPMTSYGSPGQSPPQSSQQWAPNPYQTYMPQTPSSGLTTIPYAYGQLPRIINPADPKSQHPIPGSFNRHAFNPKTQSFVPGNNGQAGQPPVQHHMSPPMQYSNSFSVAPQFGNGMGYNMSRQGSHTSAPSYHASPHMVPRAVMPQNVGLPHQPVLNMQQSMTSNGTNGSHLPHFGNPATLPSKPPPAV